MRNSIICCTLLLLLGASGILAAQEREPESVDGVQSPVRSLGLIFNTTDILLQMESFRSGIGAEIGFERFSIRAWFDLEAQTAFNPWSFTLGGAFKKQFFPGRVSPYGGASLEIGFSHEQWGYDASNWTREGSLPIGLGGMIGVEVFVLDFLSLFVQYELSFMLIYTGTTVSTAGVPTSSGEWNYVIDVGLGNSARIGIVIYLVQKNPPPAWKSREPRDKTEPQ